MLVDKSGNRKIRDGQPGYVNASQGVPLIDVPANPSREAGDVYGNPHVHTRSRATWSRSRASRRRPGTSTT